MRSHRLSTALALATIAGSALGQIVTDPSAMNGAATVLDFESLPIGPAANPLTLGNVTFSCGSGLGIASVAPWGANGTEVSERTLLPFSSGDFQFGPPYTPITLTFATPVREIGLAWFDPNDPGNWFRAYDSGGALLGEGSPQLGTPGGCCAAFIGFVSATPAIKTVVVTPAHGDDVYSIDNVRVFPGFPPPQSYCTAKASSSGCLASMEPQVAGTQPVSGAGSYVLLARHAQAQRSGIVFCGFSGPAAAPFQLGTMCVQPPLIRTPLQNSGGASPATCDGVFSLVVNAPGSPCDPGAGNSAWFQTWYRDGQLADGTGIALSNGIRLDFQ